MNKVILCEGETDAILLSYYLGKVAGWKYNRKGPENLNIQAFLIKKSGFRSASGLLRRLPLSQTVMTERYNLSKRPQKTFWVLFPMK